MTTANGTEFIIKGHSIVVSDADMERLSRLVMAPKHFLFRINYSSNR